MKDLIISCVLIAASLGYCSSLTVNRPKVQQIPIDEMAANYKEINANLKTILNQAFSVQAVNSSILKDGCGIKNAASLNGKIAGGNVASPNEYPWQAFLEITASIGYYACGGTLISNQWVLTSANCLDKALFINVYLGAHDLCSTTEYQRIKLTTNIFTIHPDWNNVTLNGDIALIRLPNPITYTNYIKPIDLPSYNDPSHEGDLVYLTGWGRTTGSSVGPLSPVLKEVTSTVISNALCSANYNNFVTDKTICSSGTGSRGICPGDLGGPMSFKKTDGTFVQIGISSFYSLYGCEMGYPSGFTRIRNYLEWISGITRMPVSNSSTSLIDSAVGLKFMLALFLSIFKWL